MTPSLHRGCWHQRFCMAAPCTDGRGLVHEGVPTTIDAAHAMAHNKVIITDGEIVMTGRFHFTQAAQERHAEHVPIVRDNAVAARYPHNRQARRQHRQPDVGRGVGR
jgi:hypothetical protein